MAGQPASRKAAYEAFLELPDNVVGEIVEGELHVSPRPSPPHAFASAALGGELIPPFQRGKGGPGGWIILDEPELHIAGQIVVPDLGGWRTERMPELPKSSFFELAPDWICEVLSKSTAAFDRAKKLPIYARAGVKHTWLVNPEVKTLEILRLEGPAWQWVALIDDRVRAEPFEAIELELAALWLR